MWGGRSGAVMGCAVGVGQGVAAPPFPPPPEVLWPLGHRGLRVQSAERKYPQHARCGRAAVRQAAECFCRGLFLAVGVRSAALRSHRVSLPLSPPSLRSCPPFAPFGRCPGAVCAPSRVGVCMPLPHPSLRSGSGGSLLAPLLPAQGRARPWANVARPPSPLSARGGDGAGLCVSWCWSVCVLVSRSVFFVTAVSASAACPSQRGKGRATFSPRAFAAYLGLEAAGVGFFAV